MAPGNCTASQHIPKLCFPQTSLLLLISTPGGLALTDLTAPPPSPPACPDLCHLYCFPSCDSDRTVPSCGDPDLCLGPHSPSPLKGLLLHPSPLTPCHYEDLSV